MPTHTSALNSRRSSSSGSQKHAQRERPPRQFVQRTLVLISPCKGRMAVRRAVEAAVRRAAACITPQCRPQRWVAHSRVGLLPPSRNPNLLWRRDDDGGMSGNESRSSPQADPMWDDGDVAEDDGDRRHLLPPGVPLLGAPTAVRLMITTLGSRGLHVGCVADARVQPIPVVSLSGLSPGHADALSKTWTVTSGGHRRGNGVAVAVSRVPQLP